MLSRAQWIIQIGYCFKLHSLVDALTGSHTTCTSADCRDGGMRRVLFHGDGIKSLADISRHTDRDQAEFLLGPFGDNRREWKDPCPYLSDRQHEGGIVKLPHDLWMDMFGIEPCIEALANGGMVRWQ